jgi:hypothetical protein
VLSKPVEWTPRVNLVGFAEYVGAPTSGRLDCVQRQVRNYHPGYRPGADFYKDFIDALQAGCRAGDDELSLQRAISRQNVAVREQCYRDLRRHWLAMPTLHLPTVEIHRAFWDVPGLRVSIAPELALVQQDQTLIVKLWLRRQESTAEAIKAMHWLLVNHLPHLADGRRAPVLDLRRRRIHLVSRCKFRHGYGEALKLKAESMGRLWQQLARSA